MISINHKPQRQCQYQHPSVHMISDYNILSNTEYIKHEAGASRNFN